MTDNSSDNIPKPHGPTLDTGKLFQGLIAAVMIGVVAWFVTIDRQVNRIGQQLSYLTKQLDVLEVINGEVGDLKSRVQRIEDTRYTKAEAAACERRQDALDARVTAIESKRRR